MLKITRYANSQTISSIIVVVFIAIIYLWPVIIWSRYFASFSHTFYYTMAIKNLNIQTCNDFKFRILQDWYWERTLELIKDPNVWLNSDGFQSYSINAWLNRMAWKCIDEIIANISNIPIDDLYWIWWSDDRTGGELWEWTKLENRWIISGTFFTVQEKSWWDPKEPLKNDYLTYWDVKKAAELWSKSDYESFNQCKILTEKKIFEKKEVSDETKMSDCVNKIHTYLLTSSTSFSKKF